MKKPAITRRALKLDTEKLKPLAATDLDEVRGGIANGIGLTAFPCFSHNNCPAPA